MFTLLHSPESILYLSYWVYGTGVSCAKDVRAQDLGDLGENLTNCVWRLFEESVDIDERKGRAFAEKIAYLGAYYL